MNVFVARQPIFDKYNNVVSYELLFRNSEENRYSYDDGNRATYQVISNSYSVIGIEKITMGKKAFINFTSDNIKNGLTNMLHNKEVVIEILESVEPDDEIIMACRLLKEKGYIIALDDFVYNPKYDKLLEFVDIIKVDFIKTKGIERKKIVNRFISKNIKFLAEKVETRDEYKEALEYGYTYYQGYFFSKPVIISGQSIPVSKIFYLDMIKEIQQKNMNVETLEKIIKKEVSISYKFLKLINSSYYCFKSKVDSMKQAIVLLGEIEVAKWLYITILGAVSAGKSEELIQISIIRAKFAENITKSMNLDNVSLDAYLMGMFSTVDVLLDQPMQDALDVIYIKEDIKKAILGENNFFGKLLKLIISYEKGNWQEVYELSSELNIDKKTLADNYIKSFDDIVYLLSENKYYNKK